MRKALLVACLGLGGFVVAAPAGSAGTLDRIRDTGTIVLGHRAQSVPFSYLDGDSTPVGLAIDLCARIVEAIRFELKLTSLEVRDRLVTPENRIALMKQGAIDIECGSTTNTAERREQVDFSVTYFVAGVRLLVRRDSGVKDYAELDGLTVAITRGTTAEALLLAEVPKARIAEVGEHDEAFRMVAERQAVAFALDDVLLAGLVARSKDPASFAIVGASLSQERYGLMLPKGDAPLKALVDRVLIGLMKSGEADKLYARWFTRPIGRDRINLNLPMSEALRKAFDRPSDEGAE